MLSNKGFDLWADDYDECVDICDNNESYPFAGYKIILNEIYSRILDAVHINVLDIGFGTGTLISNLYEHGCKISGQDFSERMLEIAQEKMPDAKLFIGDISNGLVEPLLKHKYDAIISTYSLHHLTDDEKVTFLKDLLNQLNDGGVIYIGDVSFETRAEHDICKKEAGKAWDEDEFYFVVDEMKAYFPDMKFEKISECAGIITLKK